MKQLSAGQVAQVFAGAFLGAGYVSGQELFQFFGTFGTKGLIGFGFSVLLMAFFGVVIINYGRSTGIQELDKAVVPNGPAWLRTLAGATQALALFGLMTVMFAGGGALLHQILGWPSALGCLLMALLTFAVALFGLSGMIHTFEVLTPAVVVAAIGISASAYLEFGHGSFDLAPPELHNPLIPNAAVAAFAYAGCNLFSSIGIFLPLGERISSKKKTTAGILLGTVLLALIAFAILDAMNIYPSSTFEELPMVAVAASLSKRLAYAYGVLLLGGMFGTACASTVVLSEYCHQKLKPYADHPRIGLLLLCAAAYAASLIGFGSLVGTVYPIFGYLSILLLAPILYHSIKNKKHCAE